MIGRDTYIRMLEKRASDFDGGKTGPTYDHDVDSASVANSEVKKNVADNRQTLGGLFSNFSQAQRKETEFAGKWSPTSKPEESASPLLKVAMAALSQSEHFRQYPLHYKMAAVRGFTEELEKIAFSVTEKGHKFDAEKHRMLARHSAEKAEHLQRPEYGALATTGGGASLGGIFRFDHSTSHDRPDIAARHHEYVAKKHESGKNAYNPWGGVMTPSSYEVGGSPGRLMSNIGKTKLEREKVAVSMGWVQNATRMGVAKAQPQRALQFAGRVGASGSAKGLAARGATLADPMVQRSIGAMERAKPGSVATAMYGR